MGEVEGARRLTRSQACTAGSLQLELCEGRQNTECAVYAAAVCVCVCMPLEDEGGWLRMGRLCKCRNSTALVAGACCSSQCSDRLVHTLATETQVRRRCRCRMSGAQGW